MRIENGQVMPFDSIDPPTRTVCISLEAWNEKCEQAARYRRARAALHRLAIIDEWRGSSLSAPPARWCADAVEKFDLFDLDPLIDRLLDDAVMCDVNCDAPSWALAQILKVTP